MCSKELRQKQADAWTPEMREEQSRRGKERPSNFKGKMHTEEAKASMSEKHKGKPSSFKGKHHTEEAKQKNREKHVGKPAWNKGKETGPQWWEAKGYMYEDSKYKLLKFKELYSEEYIKVMFNEDIEELENMVDLDNTINFNVIGTDINNI